MADVILAVELHIQSGDSALEVRLDLSLYRRGNGGLLYSVRVIIVVEADGLLIRAERGILRQRLSANCPAEIVSGFLLSGRIHQLWKTVVLIQNPGARGVFLVADRLTAQLLLPDLLSGRGKDQRYAISRVFLTRMSPHIGVVRTHILKNNQEIQISRLKRIAAIITEFIGIPSTASGFFDNNLGDCAAVKRLAANGLHAGRNRNPHIQPGVKGVPKGLPSNIRQILRQNKAGVFGAAGQPDKPQIFTVGKRTALVRTPQLPQRIGQDHAPQLRAVIKRHAADGLHPGGREIQHTPQGGVDRRLFANACEAGRAGEIKGDRVIALRGIKGVIPDGGHPVGNPHAHIGRCPAQHFLLSEDPCLL